MTGGETLLEVFVPGRPRTKGSLVPGHKRGVAGRACKVWLTESGKHSETWKQTMIDAIRVAVDPLGDPGHMPRYAGPVIVDTTFVFERAGTQAEMVWPVEEKGVYAHGDEDKLRRNVLDALTQSGLILDDSLVVGGVNLKTFAPFERWPQAWSEQGVRIVVRLAWPARMP